MSTANVCVQSVRGADLLLGHDPWGGTWIAAHRARKAEAERVAGMMSAPAARRLRAQRRQSDDGAQRVRIALPARRREVRDPAAPRCSMPPAGKGSRSTRPAAVTAPARVQGASRREAMFRSTSSTPRVHRRRARRRLATRVPGGGSALTSSSTCRRSDAAQGGARRCRAPRDPPPRRCRSDTSCSTSRAMEDQRSDIQRLLDAIDDLEPKPTLAVLRDLGGVLRRSHFDVTAVIVDEELIDVEPGDTTDGVTRSRLTSGRRPSSRRSSISTTVSRSRCPRCSTASSPMARRHHPDLGDDDRREGAAGPHRSRPRDGRHARLRGLR